MIMVEIRKQNFNEVAVKLVQCIKFSAIVLFILQEVKAD